MDHTNMFSPLTTGDLASKETNNVVDTEPDDLEDEDEFVDDTQLNEEINEAERSSKHRSSQSKHIPERVQTDMDFLKQSWANKKISL